MPPTATPELPGARPQCCFITENAEHIQHVRADLRMQALRFGTDFEDWRKLPGLLGIRKKEA